MLPCRPVYSESRTTHTRELKPITQVTYFYEESRETTVKPQTATSSPQHVVMDPNPKTNGTTNTTPTTTTTTKTNKNGASYAIRELDDLMASLSDFKVIH